MPSPEKPPAPEPSPEEADLLGKLRDLYDEYQRLNRKIALASQQRRIGRDPEAVARAEREEQDFLREINRLMDRMRSIEGGLLRVRGQLRPLRH